MLSRFYKLKNLSMTCHDTEMFNLKTYKTLD